MTILNQDDLLKLTLSSQALSIWDREHGPVFWYAANTPGPFYFNTEIMIGRPLAEHLLAEITAIVARTPDSAARAAKLNELIMTAYRKNAVWQDLIETLRAKADAVYPRGSYNLISGGERRDWLFSIPFAAACGLPHLFIFKNKKIYSEATLPADPATLHVSDLINNAASILDQWLPVLNTEHIKYVGNLCVNIRGDAGVKRLQAAGQQAVSLATIDLELFRKLAKAQLIAPAVLEEISVFFASPSQWAERYLFGKPELFDIRQYDNKSFERLRHFIAHDPWNLRPAHKDFFSALQNESAAREIPTS